jgi:hypothetical protein
MRSHLEILKDLENYFQNNNLTVESTELDYQVKGSATGGELCSRVGAWLLQYRKKTPTVNQSLSDLITEFIDYCHYNKIRFHSWLY